MSRHVAARAALYPFLGVVVACGLLSIEAWPLTGWKLFSRVRGPQEAGWVATAIDEDGRERPIDFAALGRPYTGSLHLMIEMPRRTAAQREAVCRTWADAIERDGSATVAAVRVYRTRSIVPVDDAPRKPSTRKLYLECAKR